MDRTVHIGAATASKMDRAVHIGAVTESKMVRTVHTLYPGPILGEIHIENMTVI